MVLSKRVAALIISDSSSSSPSTELFVELADPLTHLGMKHCNYILILICFRLSLSSFSCSSAVICVNSSSLLILRVKECRSCPGYCINRIFFWSIDTCSNFSLMKLIVLFGGIQVVKLWLIFDIKKLHNICCCYTVRIIVDTCCKLLNFNIRYCHCNLLINDQYSFESSIISHCRLSFCLRILLLVLHQHPVLLASRLSSVSVLSSFTFQVQKEEAATMRSLYIQPLVTLQVCLFASVLL